MSPDLREIEDKLAAIESTASAPEPDRPGDREFTERQSDHLDQVLLEVKSDPETSDRLEEVAQTIREEKADETPEERRTRRDQHELTDGERALLDLLTGGDGEVR